MQLGITVVACFGNSSANVSDKAEQIVTFLGSIQSGKAIPNEANLAKHTIEVVRPRHHGPLITAARVVNLHDQRDLFPDSSSASASCRNPSLMISRASVCLRLVVSSVN
jgi:hypothetical protein